MVTKEWLRKAAKETGLIKRERKIEAFIMLWTLVFNFGAHLPRNLANMKRKYEKASKKEIAQSSWYGVERTFETVMNVYQSAKGLWKQFHLTQIICSFL